MLFRVRVSKNVAFVCVLLTLSADKMQPEIQGQSATLTRVTSDGHLKQRPVWSPDGKWLCFARHQDASILLYLRSTETHQERRLTSRDSPEFDAAFSPDGHRLAFTFDKTAPGQGDLELYSVGVDGQDLRPIVGSEGKLSHEEWPSWSPDGNWLAFSSTRHGNQEIYAVHPDGTELRRLTVDASIDAHPCWSPDGKRIAFATDRWGDLEIATMKIDGSDVVRITTSRGLDDYPAWSPDGHSLAFTSNRDGNLEIYVVGPDKRLRNVSRHRAIDNFPSWLANGHLTFVSNRDRGFDIYTMHVSQMHVGPMNNEQ